MNKAQIKNFQKALGNFTPYISSLNNNTNLFIDSDISGLNDNNRNVLIINKSGTNKNDLLIKIEGFDSFEGREFKGRILIDDGISKTLIAEPTYVLSSGKAKFSTTDLRSYVQETWLQALNEYKSSFLTKPQKSNSDLSSKLLENKFVLGGIASTVCVLLIVIFYLMSGNNTQQLNNTVNQQPIINTGSEVDGKALALQNLGLDPNAMEFDNSCFTEK